MLPPPSRAAFVTGTSLKKDSAKKDSAWIDSDRVTFMNTTAAASAFEPENHRYRLIAPLARGGAPPKDAFFDSSASFIGAFRDVTDTWAAGAWIVWQPR